ncbi:MAG: homoserine dehydrogenase [Lachnospiraceae bacterium]|nr:homoserine dehydrogenase [Lachnospiraceae bacterium]
MINIAVLGYGTVGSGVVEVIDTNSTEISSRLGEDIRVKYILDLRDFPGDPHEAQVVHDIEIIFADPDISVICETMGGMEPAYTFTKKALEKGISVCTSNKELVAAHGPGLIKLAESNGCSYLFEASVGGGIPIIRPLNKALTAEHIQSITGILNGTTNYILTHMDEDGVGFEDILKEAQRLGYAERNPEADVEGHDAARKIAILSSLMCGSNVRYEDIYMEGITGITPEDFKYAHALGMSIKPLALSRETDDGFFAMVAPFMIESSHPLYMVKDVYNAVFVSGNTLGDTMYYGRGAGKLPTASAVVSDVVDCARHPGKTVACVWNEQDVRLTGIDEYKCRFFVRVSADKKNDADAVFGEVKAVDAGISGEYAFITGVMSNADFDAACGKVGGVISRIRTF